MTDSGKCAVVTAALLLAAGPALAWESREWGPYIAMDFGSTHFRANKGTLDDWTLIPLTTSSLDKGDRSFSLAAGFRFTPELAVEASYIDLGSSSYLIQDGTGAASIGFGSQGVAVSVLGTIPISRSLALEGRAGLYFGESQMRGWVRATFDLDGDLVALEGAGGGNPGFLIGGGIVASFSEHWSLRAGYDYLNGNAIAMHNPELDARMESSAWRLSLGIRYLF